MNNLANKFYKKDYANEAVLIKEWYKITSDRIAELAKEWTILNAGDYYDNKDRDLKQITSVIKTNRIILKASAKMLTEPEGITHDCPEIYQ